MDTLKIGFNYEIFALMEHLKKKYNFSELDSKNLGLLVEMAIQQGQYMVTEMIAWSDENKSIFKQFAEKHGVKNEKVK